MSISALIRSMLAEVDAGHIVLLFILLINTYVIVRGLKKARTLFHIFLVLSCPFVFLLFPAEFFRIETSYIKEVTHRSNSIFYDRDGANDRASSHQRSSGKSSIHGKSNPNDFSKFRRFHFRGKPSELSVSHWSLDENLVEEVVRNRIFNGNWWKMQWVILVNSFILYVLRAYLTGLYYLFGSIDEVKHVQPATMLFLHLLLQYLHSAFPKRVEAMNKFRLAVEMKSGYSDVGIISDSSGKIWKSNIAVIGELKRSFDNALLAGRNFQPKDQLLIEMEGIARLEVEDEYEIIKGFLSDLFAINICVRIQSSSSTKAQFIVAPRVVKCRTFIMRLLLLLCIDRDAVNSGNIFAQVGQIETHTTTSSSIHHAVSSRPSSASVVTRSGSHVNSRYYLRSQDKTTAHSAYSAEKRPTDEIEEDDEAESDDVNEYTDFKLEEEEELHQEQITELIKYAAFLNNERALVAEELQKQGEVDPLDRLR